MVKLFLRIFLITLVNILVIFVCIYFSMTLWVGPPPLDYRPSSALVVRLLEKGLDQAEPERLHAILDPFFAEQHIPWRLAEPDDPELPPELGTKMISQSRFVAFPNQHRTMMYVPALDAKKVLVIGPFISREGPPTHFMPFVFGIVVLMVGLGAMMITRPAWSNLKRFEQATERLAEGDWSARAENISHGPAVALAERFNHMAAALERYIENQKHLFQAVAHELRTPVARIHFELEMLGIADNSKDRESRSQAIVGHLDELEALLSELLVFNRLESEAPCQNLPLGVVSALTLLRDRFDDGHHQKNLTLNTTLDSSLAWPCDERLFQRALGNLVSNALRYAQEEVVVGASVNDDTLIVTVDDDGPGIPADKREVVFEPFSRLDESRNKRSGGVGLGLAIVARILQRHHGRITIETSPLGGARFICYWPREKVSP